MALRRPAGIRRSFCCAGNRQAIGEGAAEHRELTGRRADKGKGSAEDGSKIVFIIPQNSYLTFHLYFLAINYAFNNLD